MSPNYEKALEKLKELAKGTDWYQQFLILELRLLENLDKEKLFGTTEQIRHDRAVIIHRLDELTQDYQLETSFSDLSMQPINGSHKITEHEHTPSRPSSQEIEEEELPVRVQPLVYGRGKRWAVLVGINEYEDTRAYGRLQVSVQDVTALHRQLIAGGFEAGCMLLLTDQEKADRLPLRRNIFTSLQSVADASEPDDLLLFYFSGHGRARNGESYLIPRDGTEHALADTAISLERVKKIVGGARARAKVIILDACHSGAHLQAAKGRYKMSEEFIDNVFHDATGLAILSSCQAGQFSYEWPEKQSSAFTYYLLEALGGEADHDNKGFVTVHDVNRHVTNSIKMWAVQEGVSQSPTLNYLVTGDIILATYTQKVAVSTPIPTEQTNSREERLFQELQEMLMLEQDYKLDETQSSGDFLTRHHAVPLHALFLFTSEDQEIQSYIKEHSGALHYMSGDLCDIYLIEEQFKNSQNVNAYTLMQHFTMLQDAHFDENAKLPALFFWDRHGGNEYISFGNKPDVATIRTMLRVLFDEIKHEPTIASVTRAKELLGQSSPLKRPVQQEGLSMEEIPNTSNLRSRLYQILADYTNDLDLQEICLELGMNYGRLDGNSHTQRAFSLTTEMYNQDRLVELEKVLRKRLPRRFS